MLCLSALLLAGCSKESDPSAPTTNPTGDVADQVSQYEARTFDGEKRAGVFYEIFVRSFADSDADGSPRAVAWSEAPPLDFTYAPPLQKRRIALPVTLFVLTCLSTFWTGSIRGEILPSGETVPVVSWTTGALYMLCVMSILLAHELGHFFTALYYRVPASLP